MTALLLTAGAADAGVVLGEGFNGPGIPAGWVLNATATLSTTWAKPIDVNGPSGEFAAQAGPVDSYLFNSASSTPTTALGGISDLLITPLLTVDNGTLLTFYVKGDPLAESSFPDRLQVLFSTGGTTVASFTRLLLDINPTYSPTGFPTDWTLETVVLTGLAGPTSGRFAFDYLINDISTTGDFIGLDSVTVTVPEPETTLLLAIGLVGIGFASRRVRGGKVRLSAASLP